MSQIIVITLATNIYNSYIDKQIETIENFFPELHKQFIIITDQYKENYKLSDNVDIYYYHIPDMPYNITCLCKTIYGVDDSFIRIFTFNNIITCRPIVLFSDCLCFFL